MIDESEVVVHKAFRFPRPKGDGMTITYVKRIYTRNGVKKVQHESPWLRLGAHPTMEKFCELAEPAPDVSSEDIA